MSELDVNITGAPGTGNAFTQVDVRDGGTYQNYPAAAQVNNITWQGEMYASVITEIINKLASVKFHPKYDGDINVDVISIKNKVDFNKLKRWAYDVKRFTPNSADVDRIYQEYDRAGTSKTERVLYALNREYCRLSDTYQADELFDKMLAYVMEVVGKDYTRIPGIFREDVEYNARIVLVDAFIKCEIFEKPEQLC